MLFKQRWISTFRGSSNSWRCWLLRHIQRHTHLHRTSSISKFHQHRLSQAPRYDIPQFTHPLFLERHNIYPIVKTSASGKIPRYNKSTQHKGNRHQQEKKCRHHWRRSAMRSRSKFFTLKDDVIYLSCSSAIACISWKRGLADMSFFVSRRYDSCFLKWYSESELLSFSFCFFSSFASSSSSQVSVFVSNLSCRRFFLFCLSLCGIFRSVEFLTWWTQRISRSYLLLPSSHKNLTLSNIILTTPLIEYLRGTATSDECEPLFAKYKQCLSVSPYLASLPTFPLHFT